MHIIKITQEKASLIYFFNTSMRFLALDWGRGIVSMCSHTVKADPRLYQEIWNLTDWLIGIKLALNLRRPGVALIDIRSGGLVKMC